MSADRGQRVPYRTVVEAAATAYEQVRHYSPGYVAREDFAAVTDAVLSAVVTLIRDECPGEGVAAEHWYDVSDFIEELRDEIALSDGKGSSGELSR